MKLTKIFSSLLIAMILINMTVPAAFANNGAFELLSTDKSASLGGTLYRYRHKASGAEVVCNANGAERLEFAIGFKTPPTDSKGANHVLEHALFCGSEKYPTKNLMHYIQNGTSSLILNGVTADDCTYYLINTENQTEYFNMIDVYLNGIFHPLFLNDENIFRQQGIRTEYADGKAQYNGVVYNELRIKNLNTDENSVNFLSDKLYQAIYGDTTPAFSAGGELDAIKDLTYEDLLRVYNTYYIPSNSMTYIAGDVDFDKVLGVLDGFFSENGRKAPSVSFPDTKRLPREAVSEYNIDENTKTVDIGFMSSGVPAATDAREKYAWDILYDLIYKKMGEKAPDAELYTTGGNSGGIFNLALIVSEVPIERKNEIISAYAEVLRELSDNPDETEIDAHIKERQEYFYASFEAVFNGLLYQNSPIAYTEADSIYEYLKNHKEYFTEVLKKYFVENPYSAIVVSGNGMFGSEDSGVNVGPDELERIRRETEEFQKWNDAPDAPEVIDKIPFLTLDEVKNAPEKAQPVYEEQSGISFWHTEKESGEASLYFPLATEDDDFYYVQLLHYFLERQAEKAGLNFYTMLTPMESVSDARVIRPQFMLALYGDDVAQSLKQALALLRSEDAWNTDELAEYIKTAPQNILDSYYDPYFVSSELHTSALSAGSSFGYLFPQNTIVKGSAPYYQFLSGLNAADAPEIAKRLKLLARTLLIDSKPTVEYLGPRSEYEKLKGAVTDIYANAAVRESAAPPLPIGYCSAATVTRLADANHFMITAPYEYGEYSGKLAVLAKVLTAKYITPTMRGKYGAYGAGVYFYETSMTSVATGLADIDLAVSVWQGMGDYLRNMRLTQKELNAFIVSAVEEYDGKWGGYFDSEHGATLALTEKSAGDSDRIRNEMMSATVEDIRGYADFVDDLVGQMRVFAVLGKSAADAAKFNFAYYADADTLSVTPCFKKAPSTYMSEEAAPDEYMTRAETAAIISSLIADERPRQNKNIFTDISNNDLYYEDILSIVEKGIMTGYGNNKFLPDKNITRAELATVLAKFIFKGNEKLETPYKDVSENDWFYAPMAKMVNAGYMQGYEDGTLRPMNSVTHAEAAAVIKRMTAAAYDEAP